jgi:prepilin-type processing-associated H-X9-DG protein/prepilin-type N-terminal cleavage/methylation domain-containing protein
LIGVGSRPRRHPVFTPAFTLVELLVVIGIIAVLLGLLLATLSRARNASVRLACASALRQYALANQLYLNEHHDWYLPVKWGFDPNPPPPWPPPPAGLPPPTIATLHWQANPAFRRAIGQKLGQTRLPYGLVCPKAVLAINGATKAGYEPARSYGYNSTGIGWYTGPTIYYTGLKRRQVHSPATKLMFADATDWTINESASARYETLGEVFGPPVPVPQTGITAYRHERGANVAFFDGHVEWLPKKSIIKNDRLWKMTS